MTADSDTRAEPGDDDAVVALLREAPWTLPVPPGMVDDAVREVSRRRRRRVVAVALTSAAAVALVVGGVSVLAGRQAATETPSSPAVGASPTPTSAVSGRRVTVGSYSFAVPDGWVVDPLVSHSAAVFGAHGIRNDGQAPGATDMAVDLDSRRLSTADHHSQVYLTVVTPLPTAAHPGPSPAPDPTDQQAAVSTILRFGVGPNGAASATELAGVRLGPATRYATSGTSTVLVAARSTDVVIQIESVNTAEAALRALVRSGSEG